VCPQDVTVVPGTTNVWFLTQVILVIVPIVTTFARATTRVVLEFVALEAVNVVGPLSTGLVVLP